MKNLIIERIKALWKEKQETQTKPSDPNELELKRDISDLLNKELDSLIEEGKLKIIGHTINQQRILKIQ